MKPVFLYVYDHENWAIHQVGRTWQRAVADDLTFDMVSVDSALRMPVGDMRAYANVVLGYSTLVDRESVPDPYPRNPSWRARLSARARTARHALKRLRHKLGKHALRTEQAQLLRSRLAVVHDPLEVYPQVEHWRATRPSLYRVRGFERVAAASDELHDMLRAAGVPSHLVHTSPDASVRPESELAVEAARPLSICAEYARKNLPLLLALRDEWGARDEPFTVRVGRGSLSRAEYLRTLDEHNVYLCTSWQEGGPLPVMEAVTRGMAVLTTPVGQTSRWVVDGWNGFVCRSRADFRSALARLSENPGVLLEMRKASLRIAAVRTRDPIRRQLLSFLQPPTRPE